MNEIILIYKCFIQDINFEKSFENNCAYDVMKNCEIFSRFTKYCTDFIVEKVYNVVIVNFEESLQCFIKRFRRNNDINGC